MDFQGYFPNVIIFKKTFNTYSWLIFKDFFNSFQEFLRIYRKIWYFEKFLMIISVDFKGFFEFLRIFVNLQVLLRTFS